MYTRDLSLEIVEGVRGHDLVRIFVYLPHFLVFDVGWVRLGTLSSRIGCKVMQCDAMQEEDAGANGEMYAEVWKY